MPLSRIRPEDTFEITLGDVLSVVPSDGVCPITKLHFVVGTGKVGPASMTLDRINPDLGYVPGNVAVISFLANTMKNNCRDPEPFRRWASVLRSVGATRNSTVLALACSE